MLKHIILFVLVMTMVKTNADASFYYYGNQRKELFESNDKLLIRMLDPMDVEGTNALVSRINEDPNFDLLPSGYAGFYVLKKKQGRECSKEEAINYYLGEPYVASASFMFDNANGTFRGVSHQLHVNTIPGITLEMLQNIAGEYGVISIVQNQDIPTAYRLYFSKGKQNIIEIANRLYETGYFKFAEPDFFGTMKTHSTSASCPVAYTTPTDPFFASLWNLSNAGGTAYDPSINATANEDINICNAWQTTDHNGDVSSLYGNSVNVAVLDDGVDIYSTDLASTSTGYDAIPPASGAPLCIHCSPTSTYPGVPSAYNNHGTACAGIIGARLNGFGTVGVAPACYIYPVRIFVTTGVPPLSYTYYDDNWIDDGIRTAKWADVLNCSWETSQASIIDLAIDDAISNGRSSAGGNRGCVVVFSAGNNNDPNIAYPASYPSVIAVGGSTLCPERKSASSNPALVWPGVTPDPVGVSCDGGDMWGSNYGTGTGASPSETGILSVVAPSLFITTTALSVNKPPNYYSLGYYDAWGNNWISEFCSFLDGTSAGAAHVSGVAALMLEANPCLTSEEVRHIIRQTADKIPGPGGSPYTYNLTPGDPDGTWVDQVGYGRLNAGNAVAWAHDIYRQNETVTYTKTYTSSHKIFAGNNVDVTQITPTGNYIINSGSDITFFASNEISLEAGFEAGNGSTFTAEIGVVQCTSTHAHYKQGLNNKGEHQSKLFSNSKSISNVNIYPNPVNDNLNISFNLLSDGNVSISISNIVGQNLGLSLSKELLEGNHVERISTAELPAGVYVIRIKTSKGQSQFRFVKQ